MRPNSTVYQVSDLTSEMRRLMETSYPEIWIEGEISSLSKPASGHLYFSLKDSQSQLRCAMFKSRANINHYKVKAGDLVKVRAKISVYTARGDLQCIVQHVEEAGEGLLQKKFEELKQSLHNKGLFEQKIKKSLPAFPKHIGLITSPSGAAVQDILSTLKRRCPGIPVTVYPAVVQGETGARSLIEALGNAVQHQQCDVVILSRGGGSLEDLWCFNDELLAHAIYNCPIPIVSGVGHEVDITIADLVADLRAPTPTAAAELLSPDIKHHLSQLQTINFRLPRLFKTKLNHLAQTVDMTGKQLTHPSQQLAAKRKSLTLNSRRLNHCIKQSLRWQKNVLLQQRLKPPVTYIKELSHKIDVSAGRLTRAQSTQLATLQQGFSSLGDQLNLVSPLATMQRGFSISRDKQGVILRNTAHVAIGDNVSLQLADGQLECEVLSSSQTNNKT